MTGPTPLIEQPLPFTLQNGGGAVKSFAEGSLGANITNALAFVDATKWVTLLLNKMAVGSWFRFRHYFRSTNTTGALAAIQMELWSSIPAPFPFQILPANVGVGVTQCYFDCYAIVIAISGGPTLNFRTWMSGATGGQPHVQSGQNATGNINFAQSFTQLIPAFTAPLNVTIRPEAVLWESNFLDV